MDKTPHPVDVHVGARIAARRMELGFNQSQLGRALDLTFQQVQKYEKGTNRVSASKLHATAAFLGVPISYFFDGADEFAAALQDDPSHTRRSRFVLSPEGSRAIDAMIDLGPGFVRAVGDIGAQLQDAKKKSR